METYDNINPAGSPLPAARSDPSLLVDSVRESIRGKIEETIKASDREIERIDSGLGKGIVGFRNSTERIYEDIIKSEGEKIRNLSAIEIKKNKIEGVELFIKKVIDDATSSIRNDRRYGDFINTCVLSALENVRGAGATILVAAEDMIYSQNIIEKISNRGFKFKVSINPDVRVKMGGALVIDDEEEVIYNNTVERIVYRKNEDIRREIVRSLKEIREHGL